LFNSSFLLAQALPGAQELRLRRIHTRC
jgi:hypothetical protein